MEIVVAVLMLTPFAIHQPEPLRKKLAAKLKAVAADEEGNGDSSVSTSLHPNAASLSQALLPTVMVDQSYDKSYPRGIDRDGDRRLPGEGGSPGLSSMTESVSNKNKHTFAQRTSVSASASASASAFMRPMSSPFVSTTTSTTTAAGGGAGGDTSGAMKKVLSREEGAASKGYGEREKEEEERLSRPMEQTVLLTSSMKREGGLSVSTGMMHPQYYDTRYLTDVHSLTLFTPCRFV